MALTGHQRDNLTELINNAFGHVAISFSELTNQHVSVEMREVATYPIKDLGRQLNAITQSEMAAVHQIFSGPVAGDAFMLVDYQNARLLCDLLTGEQPRPRRLAVSDREVLIEVGNVLLNACLSILDDILQAHISCTVPSMQLEALGELLDSLIGERGEVSYALVIYTDFCLRDSAVGCYLMIVLDVVSLNRLLRAVEEI